METKSSKLEKEVLDMFHSLIPENQGMVASHVRIAYMTEQAVRAQLVGTGGVGASGATARTLVVPPRGQA
jgi:hypothetical protein